MSESKGTCKFVPVNDFPTLCPVISPDNDNYCYDPQDDKNKKAFWEFYGNDGKNFGKCF